MLPDMALWLCGAPRASCALRAGDVVVLGGVRGMGLAGPEARAALLVPWGSSVTKGRRNDHNKEAVAGQCKQTKINIFF